MTNLHQRLQSFLPAACPFSVRPCFLAFLVTGLASSALAHDVKFPEAILNEAAARDFPQAIYDKIRAKITHQTTFAQLSPEGLVRWSTGPSS